MDFFLFSLLRNKKTRVIYVYVYYYYYYIINFMFCAQWCGTSEAANLPIPKNIDSKSYVIIKQKIIISH